MKTVIVILGGSGSGKTSLGLALGGGASNGLQSDLKLTLPGNRVEKSCKVIFKNGFALVGNLGRGSDHVSSMEARHETVKLLLKEKRVNGIVINSLRASSKWDVEALGQLKARILYVYLGITFEENLRRLSLRRAKNEAEELSSKTLANIRNFYERANGVARTAARSSKEKDFVLLSNTDSIAVSVKKVRKALAS